MLRGLRFAAAAVLACQLIGTSCVRNDSAPEHPAAAVRIVSGAYVPVEDRVAYDGTGTAPRVVWAEGDALRVAAFVDGQRVVYNGRMWSLFAMDEKEAFDSEYMCFAGNALVPDGASGEVEEQLYAVSPAGMLADESDMLEFPAVHDYIPGSFDTDAVLMFSAPLPVSFRVDGGAVHTKAFSFVHYTGYLVLTPLGLPVEIVDEEVSSVSLRRVDGQPMAGTFVVAIDDTTGVWTLKPSDSGSLSDCVTVDYSGSGITLGELGKCWFSLLPGDYGDVEIVIETVNGARIVMPRRGLAVRSGVMNMEDVHFGDGDIVTVPYISQITGNDLGLSVLYYSSERNGEKDGVGYAYTKLKRKTSGNEMLVVFNGKGNGRLRNTTSFPGRIVRLEIENGTDGDVTMLNVSFGTAEGSCTNAAAPIAVQNGVMFVAPDDSDFRYFDVTNMTESDISAATIRITCEVVS